MNTPQILKTFGMTPEQYELLATGKVRVTGHARDAKTSRPTVTATAPAQPLPVVSDYATIPTHKLWEIHATIADGAQATAFFRAHIRPRIH